MERKYQMIILFLLIAFIVSVSANIRYSGELRGQQTFKVIDATRLDDCTYQVGLEDRNGDQFSLTQDLVKFAAMGVNVNDILIFGEL